MTLPSTLVAAVRALKSRSLAVVLVELHTSLDDYDFRKAPVSSVAGALGVSERYVYEAIDELQRLGYLEQGNRLGNARTYRLTSEAVVQ